MNAVLFSKREGYKKTLNEIQIESMNDDLRNSLWNSFLLTYFEKTQKATNRNGYISDSFIYYIYKPLWIDFFKKPIDTIPNNLWDLRDFISNYYFNYNFYEIFDFIEFFSTNGRFSGIAQDFVNMCNVVLEKEMSAYRIVGGKVTKVISDIEINEIEEAIDNPFKPVKEHLKQALDLLSDRKNPDYRNSIKESISAVESLSKLITGDEKATLGQSLKEIEKEIGVHPALKSAFMNLYGYTSDADGIRHALMDETTIGFQDAKFMLVSCSAFVSYVISKGKNAGIKL